MSGVTAANGPGGAGPRGGGAGVSRRWTPPRPAPVGCRLTAAGRSP